MTERVYLVSSVYKVAGTAVVHARSAHEAVAKALDTTAEHPVQFYFSEPFGETKMRAKLIRKEVDDA